MPGEGAVTAGLPVPAGHAPIRSRTVTGDRWAVVTVCAVLVAMTGVLLFHVARDSSNVPLAEDWYLVRPLVNHQPHFLDWIWAQNDEHRTPISRLLFLGLLKVTNDFRSGMVFDILLMAVASGGLVLAARRIRGRTAVVDAFFPILLLNLGHWETLLWSWMMQFVIVTAAIVALLAGFAASRVPLSLRATIAMGMLLVLLPLGGGSALPMVPALLVGYLALTQVGSAGRTVRRVATGAVTLTGAMVVAYFIGWHEPTWYPENPGPYGTLRTAAKSLTVAWGSGVAYSDKLRLVALLTVITLIVSSAYVLLRPLRVGGIERRRAIAVGSVIVGGLITLLALGYGRAAQENTLGIPDRYAYVALPVLLGVWFAWQLFGTPRGTRVVLWTLLVAAVIMLPFNIDRGYEWRDWYTRGMRKFEQDIDAGLPRAQLVRRNRSFLLHWDPVLLADDVELLRKAGIDPFARIPAASPRDSSQSSSNDPLRSSAVTRSRSAATRTDSTGLTSDVPRAPHALAGRKR